MNLLGLFTDTDRPCRRKEIDMKKKIVAILMALVKVFALAGCREANKVSHNVSKEADNFNVTRKLTVINARTDRMVFELIGTFSLSNNSSNELEVICETGPGEYKKHFIYLNDWTLYFVEDLSGADVNPYRYEVTIMPETVPVIDWDVDLNEANVK